MFEKLTQKNPDLLVRLLSALALGPFALFVCWYGGIYFSIFMLVATVLVFWEWNLIVNGGNRSLPFFFGVTALLLIAGLAEFHSVGAALLIGCASVPALWAFEAKGNGGWLAKGFAYSAASLISLIAIRHGSVGFELVLYLYFVVWGTDIAAYFCGRAIGGPKLWKRVSPNKTWSGAIGGFLFAALMGAAIAYFTGFMSVIAAVLLAAVLSIASQLGDLYESALKRRFGVKDSSQLIPGHGGLMDRVDGLVFAAIAAYVFGVLLSGQVADPGLGLLAL
ncbi:MULTISPECIES: phosphatidate cytidylyltransferase [Pseudovibrio]|uniref:phosphatidate cytidylyltransferase n=1 Tax=Stappiaceae TaxID=2821832 RepID=UPI00236509BB|nr:MULTISPECIES: phosphatidate cytidylyltransferase [Pseudovibrio]MDD7908580.1 phosphatidate cytidylyltransferase [Pseudovibrio exalbescens]MDX5592732.1 phosphatidate cytidylyltransferase [Pseudovibrio sp. SPO723]